MPIIEMRHVSKEYKQYRRNANFMQAFRSLFKRDYTVKKAVEDISLSVEAGELVGYIGPNGAGKSTTLKMLCGILTPTSGTITVAGRTPSANRKQNALDIGVVFGQRSQLYWDLPMLETFDLFRSMYKIAPEQFRRNVDFYVELLEMESFLDRPVRQLSLGQKMRANLAAAFLHDPSIVYLDEPTIGLDVVAKSKIRTFIREINREKQVTIILTTHDMDDIEQTCRRLVMINRGRIMHDGTIDDFRAQFGGEFKITVELAPEAALPPLDPRIVLLSENGPVKSFVMRKEQISLADAVTWIAQHLHIVDLHIAEPDIEDVVRDMYGQAEGN